MRQGLPSASAASCGFMIIVLLQSFVAPVTAQSCSGLTSKQDCFNSGCYWSASRSLCTTLGQYSDSSKTPCPQYASSNTECDRVSYCGYCESSLYGGGRSGCLYSTDGSMPGGGSCAGQWTAPGGDSVGVLPIGIVIIIILVPICCCCACIAMGVYFCCCRQQPQQAGVAGQQHQQPPMVGPNGQPMYPAPVYGQPVYGQPVVGQPMMYGGPPQYEGGQPMYGQPAPGYGPPNGYDGQSGGAPVYGGQPQGGAPGYQSTPVQLWTMESASGYPPPSQTPPAANPSYPPPQQQQQQ